MSLRTGSAPGLLWSLAEQQALTVPCREAPSQGRCSVGDHYAWRSLSCTALLGLNTALLCRTEVERIGGEEIADCVKGEASSGAVRL